jgi:hypothetical protein
VGCAAPGSQAKGAGSRFEKFVVVGDPIRNGAFDVSVEYGPDGSGWLTYSRVVLPTYVSTHLARRRNWGRTWTYIGTINASRHDTITMDGAALAGAWRYETPTLVHDPRDDPARQWKLYVERYFTVPPHRPSDSLHARGWIEVKYASRPDGRGRRRCGFSTAGQVTLASI